MSTYHIIKNGKQMEVSSEELDILNESNESIELDVQWYLSHGYVTSEEFEKQHRVNDFIQQ